MNRRRGGISKAAAGLSVLVVILAGVAGYGFLNPQTSVTTTTVNKTQTTTALTTVTLTTTLATASSSSSSSAISSSSPSSTSASSASTSTNSISSSAALIRTPNNQTLIAMAMAEGTMTIYTERSEADFQKIVNAFNVDFPWATIKFASVDGNGMYTALAGENASGKHTIDWVDGDQASMYTNIANGFTAKYINPVAVANFPSNAYDHSGAWTADYESLYGLIYNYQTLPSSQLPKTWQDLANPTWNNKLVMGAPNSVSRSAVIFSGLYPSMGNSTWTTWMNGIVANHPTIASSTSVATTQLIQGQKQLQIGSDWGGYATAVSTGAPLHWVWLNPQPLIFSENMVVGHAPHPNMAKLFAQWSASVDGQTAWASENLVTILPVGASASIIPGNVTLLPVVNIFGSNVTTWRNVYNNLFPPTG